MNLNLYVKSMGKFFKVRKVCYSETESNEYCARHRDTGVIAVDESTGMIFVADLYQATVPSGLIRP